ncbi:MAG TPA: DUF4190 domain-containing protein [Pirellulales bacterium]
MSIGVQSHWAAAGVEAEAAYRPLCTLAVASCLWAVVSLAAFADWSLTALPILGIVLGAWGWQRVRRHPDALAGRGLAIGGIVANVLVLAASCLTLSYVQALEVPPGCTVIDYDQLQPDPSMPGQQVSAQARKLDGRRVLLKGYALAGRHTDHIKQFVLVRDNQTCCFGGNPKLADMVAVTLGGKREWKYTPDMLRVAGTFHVVEPAGTDGRRHPLYRLDADYLQ